MGLRAKERGPSAAVHKAYYSNMDCSSCLILVIENVPEYEERVVRASLSKHWTLVSVRIDPRILGLAAARARVFIIAYRNDKLRWVSPFSLASMVGCLSSRVVLKAKDYFWMNLPPAVLSDANAPFVAFAQPFSYPQTQGVWFDWSWLNLGKKSKEL